MGMLAMIIYINYFKAHEFNLTKPGAGWFSGFMGSYVLYLLPFLTAFLLQPAFYHNHTFFKSKWFWFIIFLAPAIFSFRVNFTFHHALIRHFFSGDSVPFWIRCSKWFTGLFTALIPVFCIWFIKDRNREPFYGTAKLGNARPYLLMIALMIPLITLAATQPDFLKMYPRAKVVTAWNLHPKWLYYALHELSYSLDFITIEMFFRGFLILSLINICGKQCIVPAACFYCCIHLGKPMGEAISSFFGGLLLGIVSYNTKSIRGGLIVHLGIAWLMEIAGFIALSFN